jgi:hypothetical protein
MSLDEPTRILLDRSREKGKSMSQLVEKCVKATGEQFDPGPACETVAKVLQIVDADMDKAKAAGNFDQVQALAGLRNDLQPYARVCELPKT